MNEIYIIGTINEKIEFKFVVNNKRYFSKVKFKLKTLDKQILKIVCYNDVADLILKNIKERDKIIIRGRINSKSEIEIKEYNKV